MERRHVLAAISAAIATPAGAWLDHPKSGGASEGDVETHFREVRPFVGLTEAEQKVKRFLSAQVQEYIGRLIETPGHSPIVDLWVLCEALLTHNCDHYGDEFGGLLSAIEDVTRSDRRFVVVPEEIYETVNGVIEFLKENASTQCTVGLFGDGDTHEDTHQDLQVEPWKDAPAEA